MLPRGLLWRKLLCSNSEFGKFSLCPVLRQLHPVIKALEMLDQLKLPFLSKVELNSIYLVKIEMPPVTSFFRLSQQSGERFISSQLSKIVDLEGSILGYSHTDETISLDWPFFNSWKDEGKSDESPGALPWTHSCSNRGGRNIFLNRHFSLDFFHSALHCHR